MASKAERMFDELYDGYQALGSVILTDEWERARLIAYLDGYADAMAHASWALEEEQPRLKRLFCLLPSRKLRKAVREAMQEQRKR